MQRSMPIITTKVAVIGGFLLLGLLAVAVWLLASASPASAQTHDARTATESASTHPATAQQPTTPAPPDSIAPPPVDLQVRAPDLPPLPTDLNALTPTLPSVTDVLPPPLQPAVNNVSELLPAPARAPIAPLLPAVVPPPPRVDVAPGGSAQSDATQPSGPSVDTPTTADAAPRWWPPSHGHHAGELRASDSSSHEGDTRAPSGVPSPVAAQGSLVSSSAGRDFGQSMLLFGVVAAGIIFLLGRGRRLWREATGWLPAPWCLLIERPG